MLGVVAYESIHLVGYGLAQRLHGFPGAVFLSVLPPTYEELNSTGSSSLGGGHSAYIHELVHHEVLGGQLSSTLVAAEAVNVYNGVHSVGAEVPQLVVVVAHSLLNAVRSRPGEATGKLSRALSKVWLV